MKTAGEGRIVSTKQQRRGNGQGRGRGLTGVVEVVDVQVFDLIDRWELLGCDRPSAHGSGRQVCWLAVGGGGGIPILLRRQCASVGGWHDSSRSFKQPCLEVFETGGVHIWRGGGL